MTINGAYFLYHPPRKGSTGHCSILIIDSDDVYYFSLYHDHVPSFIRKLPFKQKFSDHFNPFIINSYEKDVISRGKSWDEIDKGNRLDFPAGEIMKCLSNEDLNSAHYYENGKFAHMVKLPNSVDYKKLKCFLEDLQGKIRWTLFSSVSGKLHNNHTYHNCASAIALGIQESKQKNKLPPFYLPEYFRLSLAYMMGYFLFNNGFKLEKDFSSLPFIYAFLYFGKVLLNTFQYLNDLMILRKESHSAVFIYGVYMTCLSMNILASPFNMNMCQDMFIFPSNLFRSVKSMGAKEVKDQKQIEMSMRLHTK